MLIVLFEKRIAASISLAALPLFIPAQKNISVALTNLLQANVLQAAANKTAPRYSPMAYSRRQK
jgi:hypothetical protein